MDSEFEFGPKMQALDDRRKRFVLALVEDPMISGAEAARRAGYSDVAEGAKVRAHGLMHDKRVVEALQEQAGKRLWSVSLKAAGRVETMIDSDDEKIALKASLAVLDRVGWAAQQNININQTVTDQSGKGILKRIEELADRLGVPKAGLLGGPSPIEGEFSEVSDG
jgi:phage terminase small subunit